MNTLNNPKVILGLLTAILFMSLMSTCNSCSNGKKISRLKSEVDSLQKIVLERPTRIETGRMIKAEGLRSSKRTLYDWNAVVRTAVRPDDRMNQYDQEIKSLEE